MLLVDPEFFLVELDLLLVDPELLEYPARFLLLVDPEFFLAELDLLPVELLLL